MSLYIDPPTGRPLRATATPIKRKVPKIARNLARMVDEYGPQCDEYEPGCPCCEAWRLFNGTAMRFPTDAEVTEAIKAAINEQGEQL